MFIVELKQNENNKLIYEIKTLLHCRITFEPPRPKREIPQCAKCQQYGHTKAYCRRSPKCIKCAGNHLSADCTRKYRSEDVKCVLCEGNHPANYKGCRVYKELQMVRFPSTREKVLPSKEPTNKISTDTVTNTNPTTLSKPTYAQVPKNNMNQLSQDHTNLFNSKEINDTCKIKDILKQIMQQLAIVTNLLSNLMIKLSNSTP